MRYSKVLSTLQNLTGFRPTQADLCRVLGMNSSAMANRAMRDSDFKDEELEKLERQYGVLFRSEIKIECEEFEYININPSCGAGTYILDDVDITPIRIGKELVKDIWGITNPKNLKIFKANGDSMSNIIEDSDLLLVDITQTDFTNGGVFLLTINNNWFIKRLRMKVTGELEVISDNAKYPPEIIKPNSDIEVSIKGRVIKNLSRGL